LARQQSTSPKAIDFYKELSNYSVDKALNPPSQPQILSIYISDHPQKKKHSSAHICVEEWTLQDFQSQKECVHKMYCNKKTTFLHKNQIKKF
jgi:hypothetical protein